MPQMNMVMAINEALRSAMRRDKRVVVLGEDVGKVGGVFRVTAGLQEEFGEERVIDTPLSENGIVGCAVGMALYGMVPVVEIQFADFIWPAYDQIVNVASRGKPGAIRVIPGDPENSYLVHKIEGRSDIVGRRMPQAGPPYLTDGQILILKRWIATGAPRN